MSPPSLSLPKHILVAIALLFALAGSAVGQGTAARPARAEIELKPAAAEIGGLELLIPDPASGRSARRAISDLLVRLRAPGQDIGAALALGNDIAIDRDDGLMQAQLYIVAQGRLLAPAQARCERWSGDTAVCTLHCDGGAFALRRTPRVSGLTLVLGGSASGGDDEPRPAIRLDACAAGTGPELLMAPARGKPSVSLALHPFR